MGATNRVNVTAGAAATRSATRGTISPNRGVAQSLPGSAKTRCMSMTTTWLPATELLRPHPRPRRDEGDDEAEQQRQQHAEVRVRPVAVATAEAERPEQVALPVQPAGRRVRHEPPA